MPERRRPRVEATSDELIAFAEQEAHEQGRSPAAVLRDERALALLSREPHAVVAEIDGAIRALATPVRSL